MLKDPYHDPRTSRRSVLGLLGAAPFVASGALAFPSAAHASASNTALESRIQRIAARPEFGGARWGMQFYAADTGETLVEEVMDGTLAVIRQTPLAFTPGTQYRHSNDGFFVLGAMVARVSGLSYFDYVRRHVFAPAGMTRSDFFTRLRHPDRPDRGAREADLDGLSH
jgi:hypothetical protein